MLINLKLENGQNPEAIERILEQLKEWLYSVPESSGCKISASFCKGLYDDGKTPHQVGFNAIYHPTDEEFAELKNDPIVQIDLSQYRVDQPPN